MSMIHDITSTTPRNKRPTRKGRGESGGHGKTSGKGTKGAGARSGGPYWKRGHEGGQTSVFRRFPKRGFSNRDFERRFHIVNLFDLNDFADGTTVDAAALNQAGLIPDNKQPVKILGQGELTRKLSVTAGWYSKSAHEKILAAGGTASNLDGEAFVFPKPKKKFILRVKEKKGADAAAPEAKATDAKATDTKAADAKGADAKVAPAKPQAGAAEAKSSAGASE